MSGADHPAPLRWWHYAAGVGGFAFVVWIYFATFLGAPMPAWLHRIVFW